MFKLWTVMKLYFNINFRAKMGENLQVLITEDGTEDKIYPLNYTDNGNWSAEVDYFSKSKLWIIFWYWRRPNSRICLSTWSLWTKWRQRKIYWFYRYKNFRRSRKRNLEKILAVYRVASSRWFCNLLLLSSRKNNL